MYCNEACGSRCRCSSKARSSSGPVTLALKWKVIILPLSLLLLGYIRSQLLLGHSYIIIIIIIITLPGDNISIIIIVIIVIIIIIISSSSSNSSSCISKRDLGAEGLVVEVGLQVGGHTILY